MSPSVYEFICEGNSYSSAINVLRNPFVKSKNEVYARHLLTGRRQQSGEFLDEYLQSLKQMSKDCNFRDVTASKRRDEAIRDSLISGLLSK